MYFMKLESYLSGKVTSKVEKELFYSQQENRQEHIHTFVSSNSDMFWGFLDKSVLEFQVQKLVKPNGVRIGIGIV